MPGPQEAAISTIIQGWKLKAIAEPWEAKIKAVIQDPGQLADVEKTLNGRAEAITKACDDQVKTATLALARRVEAFVQTFMNAILILESGCSKVGESGHLISLILQRLDSQFEAFLEGNETASQALDARLRAVTEEWRTRPEPIGSEPFKAKVRDDRYKAVHQARESYDEAIGQVQEAQSQVGGQYVDALILSDRIADKGTLAQIHGIYFIKTHLLPTLSEDTKMAFFEKNEEMTHFFVLLTSYWHAVGPFKQVVPPLFFVYQFRKKLQLLREEYSSADLTMFQPFLTDCKIFNDVKGSLKDNPLFEKLRELSLQMLENEEFSTTFMKCWRAVAAFPSPTLDPKATYEAYKNMKLFATV